MQTLTQLADAARAELSPATEQSGEADVYRKHPMHETMQLAEVVLSDCGQSTTIGNRLQIRVADRIQRYVDLLLGNDQQSAPAVPEGWRDAIQNASAVLGWMATRSDVCRRDMERMEAADAALRALLAAAPGEKADENV